jgi:hypothetical protein
VARPKHDARLGVRRFRVAFAGSAEDPDNVVERPWTPRHLMPLLRDNKSLEPTPPRGAAQFRQQPGKLEG